MRTRVHDIRLQTDWPLGSIFFATPNSPFLTFVALPLFPHHGCVIQSLSLFSAGNQSPLGPSFRGHLLFVSGIRPLVESRSGWPNIPRSTWPMRRNFGADGSEPCLLLVTVSTVNSGIFPKLCIASLAFLAFAYLIQFLWSQGPVLVHISEGILSAKVADSHVRFSISTTPTTWREIETSPNAWYMRSPPEFEIPHIPMPYVSGNRSLLPACFSSKARLASCSHFKWRSLSIQLGGNDARNVGPAHFQSR